MGAADVVPGVSGGTIAFITGIYDRLLSALNRLSQSGLKVLVREGVRPFWIQMDLTFLLVLGLGVLTSLGLFAHLISFILHEYPEALWSFFFGLVLSAILIIGREVPGWTIAGAGWLVLGIFLGVWVAFQVPVQVSPSLLMIAFAGGIAICAMILPGISGSFILLLLGLYETLITAIKTLQWDILLSFVMGSLLGLLAFVRVVSYFIKHYTSVTYCFLLGLMIGSLIKIWPWKVTASTRVNSHGELVPFLQKNVSPFIYMEQFPESVHFVLCLCIMGVGVILMVGMQKWFAKD